MQSGAVSQERSVLHLVVTWALMIPLIYFAGGFWLQHTNALSGDSSLVLGVTHTAENTASVLLVFPIVIGLLVQRGRQVLSAWLDNFIFLGLNAWALFSSLWSQLPMKSFEWSLCLLVNTLFAFVLYQRFTAKQKMKLLLLLGWICLILSITLALFFPQYGVSSIEGVGAWKGIYLHKNICAVMTVMFLSAAFYTPAIGLMSKAFRFIYVGLSVCLVLMTQSATGKIILLWLFVWLFCGRVVRKFALRDKAAALLVAATVGLIVLAIGVQYASEIMYFLDKDPTLSGRTEIWRAVLVPIMKHPVLGYGYMAFWRGLQGESGNFSLTNNLYIVHAHNGFLEIWLELGLVGMGLFLWSMIKAIRDAFACIQRGRAGDVMWFAFIVSLVAIVNIDEVVGMLAANNLIWILYVLACVGLSDSAKRVRLGNRL